MSRHGTRIFAALQLMWCSVFTVSLTLYLLSFRSQIYIIPEVSQDTISPNQHSTGLQHRRLIKPTFQFFADWLEEWADISRINKDTCPSTSVQSQIETPLPNKGLTNTSANFNSKRPLQPLKPVQRSSSRGSQKSNPGDREYRDVVKQIHNQTPKYTNYKFQNSSPGEKQRTFPFRHPQSRDHSPPLMDRKCAWCTENGITHNHATPDCVMFQNANAEDQWKVIRKRGICDSCLLPGHSWQVCRNKVQQSCPTCGNSHHPNIGCIPQRRTSSQLNHEDE